MKVAIVLGTRPEIIKLSPVIRKLSERNMEFVLIHSNQHYSSEMDEIFFQELQLPQPHKNLEVGSGSHSEMTAKILQRIEPILVESKPNWVAVQGDTNTVLGAALTASKLEIPVAHIEAGLRSFDRSMPEEINRVVVDHISSALFCPTQTQQDLLLREGISGDNIFVTGNTIVEAVHQNLRLAPERVSSQPQLSYCLVTMHRPSNVDSPESLRDVLQSLHELAQNSGREFVLPLHPRTKAKMQEFSLAQSEFSALRFIEPVGYLEMLALMRDAEVIFTDSGGVQEEACILRVPCITIRENTERPETVEVGANRLSGRSLFELKRNYELAMSTPRDWENPFGDDLVSDRILDQLLSLTDSH